MKAIQKSSENTNTKTKTMTKTKTKTQKKCLKHPTYAIFLKSWWLTHSKYDDRYLTLVILFTPVTLITLVNLFQPYIQFYRAECITVSGFFASESILMLHIGLQLLSCCRCVCICLCLLAPFPWGIRIPVSQRLFFWISRIETNKCRASLWPISPQNIFQII